MHWKFRSLAIVLAFVLLLVVDRQFRDFEPSIANKYPCAKADLLSSEYGSDLLSNITTRKHYRLPDGTIVNKHQVQRSKRTPDLLLLTLIKDASSYGHDRGQPTRTFQDYLNLLMSSKLNLREVSLGIATESKEELDNIEATIQAMTARYGYFPQVTLVLNIPSPLAVDRTNRHQLTLNAQNARRSYISQLRNTLTFHSLQSESQVLWLDADVNYFSPNIIPTMLAHQYSNPAAGLITARCQEGPTYDYDKNAWAGERFRGADARVDTRRNVAELIKGTNSNDLIPLSSIGGTILLIRSSLISRGLVFPVTPIIGAEWGKEGWDGVETEGLCVLARGFDDDVSKEGGCYVLGGNHYVGHTNF